VTSSRPGEFGFAFRIASGGADSGSRERVVRVDGVVMGRGKGTPQLPEHVRKVGRCLEDATDDSDGELH